MHEQSVIGASTDHTNLDAEVLLPAGVTIEDVKSGARVEVVDGGVLQDLEGLGFEGSIDVSPPNFFLSDGIHHDALVLGHSSCLQTREGTQSTAAR